ncbi:unannotated protein [freshwater metagenome]|uniref:Unannotated protein n=1 Tax=freshwater metagenome TaxID=449393 RepID=A0A6J7KBF5_9ZZZZ|nr:hypothetical protein [Actinomycetota bacterium]
MSGRYLIRIEAWPYSLEEGRDVAQALAGPRVQTFIVPAGDIRAALAKAELFRDGMLTNPHVHQAPITEVRLAMIGEEARFDRPCVTSVREVRQKRATPTPTPGGLAEGER